MKITPPIKHLLHVSALVMILLTANITWANSDTTTININVATAEEIATHLEGIGLKKAQAIVAWREEHGNFSSKEELTSVKGIGESTLAKNIELISTGQATDQ